MYVCEFKKAQRLLSQTYKDGEILYEKLSRLSKARAHGVSKWVRAYKNAHAFYALCLNASGDKVLQERLFGKRLGLKELQGVLQAARRNYETALDSLLHKLE